MKTLKSNVVIFLLGKSTPSELHLNEENQRVPPKQSKISAASFVWKISILIFIVTVVGLSRTHAQTKRVWGNVKEAKFQPFGESYVGFMTGSDFTPTGASALMYINPNSAIHAYSAIKGGVSEFSLNNETLLGLAYQPQLTFRTGILNCGYYLSIGGELSNDRRVQVPTSHSSFAASKSNKLSPQYRSVTQSSVNLGVGMFFEVNGKWQVFAERVGRFNNTTLSYGERMYYTSIGLRLFMLNGIKK